MDEPDAGDLAEPEREPEPEEWLEPEDLTDEEIGWAEPLPGWVTAEHRRRRRQVREAWRYLPDDPLPESPTADPAGVGSVVRALRWYARLSQRELADWAGVPVSTVARAEQPGEIDLRLSTLAKLVGSCGLRLAVVDDQGTQLAVPFGQDQLRDHADRRLPAHRLHAVRRRPRAVGIAAVTSPRQPPRPGLRPR